MMEEHALLLDFLCQSCVPLRRCIITYAKRDTIVFLVECIINFLAAKIPCSEDVKRKLRRYRTALRLVAASKSVKQARLTVFL